MSVFPEGMNMNDMVAQAKAMQSQLMQAQQNLQASSFTGTSGGGLVAVTVMGTGEVVDVKIQPAAIDPGDPEGLADLIIAAAHAAHAQVLAQAQAAMAAMPNLSSLGL